MTRIIAELLSSRFCSNCVLFASSPSVYDSLTYASALVVVPSNWFFRAGLSMRLVRLKPQGRAPIGVGPPGPHWAPKFLEKNCGLRKLLDSTFAIRKLYIAASAPGIGLSVKHFNVALRIYLCMLVTNCSGESSFSVLSWVKNEIRTTMPCLSWLLKAT